MPGAPRAVFGTACYFADEANWNQRPIKHAGHDIFLYSSISSAMGRTRRGKACKCSQMMISKKLPNSNWLLFLWVLPEQIPNHREINQEKSLWRGWVLSTGLETAFFCLGIYLFKRAMTRKSIGKATGHSLSELSNGDHIHTAEVTLNLAERHSKTFRKWNTWSAMNAQPNFT